MYMSGKKVLHVNWRLSDLQCYTLSIFLVFYASVYVLLVRNKMHAISKY